MLRLDRMIRVTQLLHSRFPIDDPSLDKGIQPETTIDETRGKKRSVSARQSATVTNPLLVTRSIVDIVVCTAACCRERRRERRRGEKGEERERERRKTTDRCIYAWRARGSSNNIFILLSRAHSLVPRSKPWNRATKRCYNGGVYK